MRAVFLTFAVALAVPAEASEILTLPQAIAKASERSPKAHMAQASQQVMEAKEREARSGGYPQLGVSAGGYSLNMLGGGLGSPLNIPGMGAAAGLNPAIPHIGQVQASATQVLYDGGRIGQAVKMAKLGREAAELDWRQAHRKAQFEAAIAYLNVLKTQRLVEVASGGVAKAEAHLALAVSRLKGGTGARFEVLQAEAQVSNAKALETKARTGLAIARLALETMVGEPFAVLDAGTAVPPSAPPPSLDAALRQRLDYQQVQLMTKVDEAGMSLQRLDSLPTVAGMGNYIYQPGGSHYYLLGASVQFSVFNGSRTDARIAQAEGAFAKDTHLMAGLRDAIAMELHEARLAREEATSRISAYADSLRMATELYRLAVVRYRAGVGTSTEVIDAQNALDQAGSNHAIALHDAQIAEVRLYQAMGMELDAVLAVKGRQS